MKSIRITNGWNSWFYVLPGFIEICPNYKKHSYFTLRDDFGLLSWLHREDGPAVISPIMGFPLFYLEGKKVTEAEVINYAWNQKLLGLLDE